MDWSGVSEVTVGVRSGVGVVVDVGDSQLISIEEIVAALFQLKQEKTQYFP